MVKDAPTARLVVELDDIWLKLVEITQNAERLGHKNVVRLLREGREKVDLSLTMLLESKET